MTAISRSDLQYTYSWTALRGDDPRLTGRPDDIFLNRHEGYEVLAFLNSFCASHTWNKFPGGRVEALKAERLIRTQLPGEVRSRKNVTDWLVKYWSIY